MRSKPISRKMLLGLQDIDANRQEPRNDRLYFHIESLAHAARYCTDPSLRSPRCNNVVTCHQQHYGFGFRRPLR